MENILVVGANGTTGKEIVSILKASEHFNPIAMVRKGSQVDQFKHKRIDTVLGDLTKDLTHVTDTIDKIIFAAGSGGEQVVEVDQEGAKSLIDLAKKAKIKRFVMLSSMGADQPEAVDELEDYLKAKQKADEYLRASGLNYVIVRPGALNNEDGTGKIELSQNLNKQGEISRADVAQTLVKALHDDAPSNTSFEILQGETSIEKAFKSLNETTS